MFQESEVICLAFGVAFMAALLFLAKEKKFPKLPVLYAGVLMLFCAQVFTVAEHFFWGPVFGLAEHVCYMLAGVCFAIETVHLASMKSEEQGHSWNS